MSIRIGHGYRVHHDDINWFLDLALEALAPVRDQLDATLFAEQAAGVHDAALRGIRPFTRSTLQDEALAEYMDEVTDANPAYVWHHPHSLDFDYGRPNNSGPWYLLLQCQRDAYHEAFRLLPGVEPYEYYNHTDLLPDGVTQKDWEQRRTDWQWLLDARRIKDVTTRRTYRDDPAPDLAYVTHPDVFTRHLPTRAKRAKTIARDLTLTEALTHVENPQWDDINDALWSRARRAHAERISVDIADQLPPLSHAALRQGQPEPVTFTVEPLPNDWRDHDRQLDEDDDE